jgi:hypothetical protein
MPTCTPIVITVKFLIDVDAVPYVDIKFSKNYDTSVDAIYPIGRFAFIVLAALHQLEIILAHGLMTGKFLVATPCLN